MTFTIILALEAALKGLPVSHTELAAAAAAKLNATVVNTYTKNGAVFATLTK